VMASFDVCHPALALRAVVGVQCVLAVAVLTTAPGWEGALQAAGPAAFIGVAATGLWLVLLCALKGLLRHAGTGGRAAAALGLGAAMAVLAWWPLALVEVTPPLEWHRALGVAAAGALLAGVLWAWLDLRARLWQPAHTQARLMELQARIRPHFLFNALNTALALVRVDPQQAETVLEDLSALFRTALADAGTAVPLSEEIELAERYLAIEQVRFGARLKVRWQVDTHDPRIARARVPPLVLQPLVENAVRHGVEPSEDGGRIHIEARVQRGQVLVVVSNTVPPEPSQPGHGMALANVRERLQLLHDVAGQLDTWREEGPAAEGGARFHARITVPLE
jgi:two-component system, LytTR family, sensor histidine kinase AlgZ